MGSRPPRDTWELNQRRRGSCFVPTGQEPRGLGPHLSASNLGLGQLRKYGPQVRAPGRDCTAAWWLGPPPHSAHCFSNAGQSSLFCEPLRSGREAVQSPHWCQPVSANRRVRWPLNLPYTSTFSPATVLPVPVPPPPPPSLHPHCRARWGEPTVLPSLPAPTPEADRGPKSGSSKQQTECLFSFDRTSRNDC